MRQKVDYIHMNPVVAEIVAEPHHYLYSSAIDYSGRKGLIDVIFEIVNPDERGFISKSESFTRSIKLNSQ